MRQFPIPDQNAEAPVIEKRLVHARDGVDDAGNPPSVVWPAPLFARNRKTSGNRTIDVGVVEGFDSAVCQSGAREETKVRCKLLLEIETDAHSTGVIADRRDIGGLPRQL